MMAGHITVGDGVFLSGNVVLHQFSQIGRLAMVAGSSAVRQDIVPFCLADGHPARPKGLNTVGLQRAGFSRGQLRTLKRAYRILFGAGGSMATRLEGLRDLSEQESGVPEVAELVRFVEASERGIARPR